jgi:hypothetical protein
MQQIGCDEHGAGVTKYLSLVSCANLMLMRRGLRGGSSTEQLESSSVAASVFRYARARFSRALVVVDREHSAFTLVAGALVPENGLDPGVALSLDAAPDDLKPGRTFSLGAATSPLPRDGSPLQNGGSRLDRVPLAFVPDARTIRVQRSGIARGNSPQRCSRHPYS